MVDRDRAVVCLQCPNDVAIVERPRRIPMHHQNRSTTPFIDVVHSMQADRMIFRIPREQGSPAAIIGCLAAHEIEQLKFESAGLPVGLRPAPIMIVWLGALDKQRIGFADFTIDDIQMITLESGNLAVAGRANLKMNESDPTANIS